MQLWNSKKHEKYRIVCARELTQILWLQEDFDKLGEMEVLQFKTGVYKDHFRQAALSSTLFANNWLQLS